MIRKRVAKPLVAAVSAAALCATMAVTMTSPAFVPLARADTYGDLVNAQNQKAASAQREAELKAQLAGVRSDLASKILELDDLTNNRIPAAQAAVEKANETAAAAQSDAEAAAQRLEAARKDKSNLEEQIKKTGKDYDDAHAAVAQMARDSLHGSNASDVMSVVTGSKSTTEFVNAMQSRQALSRSESNAASSAAESLNTSMNRSERLSAIEQRIADLKTKADEASAAAQTSAASAQQERESLDQLRADGEKRRAELESLEDQLGDASAKQAAQTVVLQSRIDSLNRQYQQEQWQAAQNAGSQNQGQGTSKPPTNSGTTGGSTTTRPNTGGSTGGTTTARPNTGSTGGQGTSNGDIGNRYVAGQCTWYAYNRRKEMGIGTPSWLGNGGDWWRNAPSYGLRVDHNPQVGAALSFLPGQDGADGVYGHVAVVEAVYSNGTFMISEMNWGGPYIMHSRVLTNAGQYWFVH